VKVHGQIVEGGGEPIAHPGQPEGASLAQPWGRRPARR
jgi:hypothetical protein